MPGSLHIIGWRSRTSVWSDGRDDRPFPPARHAGQARARDAGRPNHRYPFLLRHVLPSGFKRVRHLGLLAPAAKATRLSLARAGLVVPEPDPGDHGDGGGLPPARIGRTEVSAAKNVLRRTVHADGGDSAPASGDSAERTGSRTLMAPASARRGLSTVLNGSSGRQVVRLSAACRSLVDALRSVFAGKPCSFLSRPREATGKNSANFLNSRLTLAAAA